MCWVRNNPKPSDVVHDMEPKFRADIRNIAMLTPYPGDDRWSALSPREVEVAERLAVGQINRQIARELGISVKTIDTHRGKLLKRLGLKNNTELARAYVARQLLAAIADDVERCRTATT